MLENLITKHFLNILVYVPKRGIFFNFHIIKIMWFLFLYVLTSHAFKIFLVWHSSKKTFDFYVKKFRKLLTKYFLIILVYVQKRRYFFQLSYKNHLIFYFVRTHKPRLANGSIYRIDRHLTLQVGCLWGLPHERKVIETRIGMWDLLL